MPSAELFATADGSVADLLNELDAASPIWSSIDDDPASPVDTDWANNSSKVFGPYLKLDGNGDYVITADKDALDITGDIDLVARVSCDNFVRPQFERMRIIDKQDAYNFIFVQDSALRLEWHDGASFQSRFSTVTLDSVGIVDDQPIWVRATLDVDDGASDAEIRFFYSEETVTDPADVTWIQLGDPIAFGSTTTIRTTTLPMAIGVQLVGFEFLKGKIYGAWVYSGIPSTPGDPPSGTLVASPDFHSKDHLDYVFLDGTLDHLTTADKVALDIIGDLELIALVALDDWTPASDNTIQAKDDGAGSRHWRFLVRTDGALQLSWSTDGTAVSSQNSVTATGGVDGQHLWLRVTFDVDNGATNADIKFWISSDSIDTPVEAVTWVQLGTTKNPGAVQSIFSGGGSLQLGARTTSGNNPLVGKIYGEWVYDGIGGTLVADADFRRKTHKDFVYFDGTDDGVQTIDKPSLDITGDLEIISCLAVDDWTPPTGWFTTISKFGGAGQRSFRFQVDDSPSGALVFIHTENGTDLLRSDSDANIPGLVDGRHVWVRGTLDVDNEAVGHDKEFFYSFDPIDTPVDDVVWTKLGTTITTAGTTSIHSGTANLVVGNQHDGAQGWAGKSYGAWVYNGIGGTLVASPDWRSFDMLTDPQGNNWTKNADADWGRWPDESQGNTWDFLGDTEWGQWPDDQGNSWQFIADAYWAFVGGYFPLTDMASDMDRASSADLTVRYKGQNFMQAPINLYARFYDVWEITPLSDEVLVATVNGISDFDNTSLVTVTGIVPADKATWDDARLRFRWSDV